MANILLLEPAYKNKYPPLGLMKIARYHLQKKDAVRFAKGTLPKGEASVKWDRVYITTLFTFEWKEIIKCIEYAISICPIQNKIYIGGITATLMPDSIAAEYPEINVVVGLLNVRGSLGYDDDECIDSLSPDYFILDQIEYKYPAANAYFGYATRGCGRNCSFCAVKTLEPEYIPWVSIKNQIEKVREEYGQCRDLRNLLLMDNNVLKSPYLREIIDEIKEVGFAKGAKSINPETGKAVQRSVDFNQGLDGTLITEEKAKMLAEIALRPVRIAFDHIEQKASYVKAIKTCVGAGLRNFSNYILYNSEDGASWKGHPYLPDTPEDLYERLMTNVELQEELNMEMHEEARVAIYSFPMRYIPLGNKERKFVGEKWNLKFLRAIQAMLNPTQGKGVSGRSFFSASFGANVTEYMRALAMPEHLIVSRGRFVEDKVNESSEEKQLRLEKWKEKHELIEQWTGFYEKLSSLDEFHQLISDNKFSAEKFNQIEEDIHKKLYLYYFSELSLMGLFDELNDRNKIFVKHFFEETGSILYKSLVDYINAKNVSPLKLIGFVELFGYKDIERTLYNFAVPKQLLHKLNKLEENVPSSQRYHNEVQQSFSHWEKAFRPLDKWSFIYEILLNEISIQNYKIIKNKVYKQLYIHYLSENQLLDLLEEANTEEEIAFLYKYCGEQCPSILNIISETIYNSRSTAINQKVIGFIRVFELLGVNTLLNLWLNDENRSAQTLDILERSFICLNQYYADIKILSALQEYLRLMVFSPDELMLIKTIVSEGQYGSLQRLLIEAFHVYREKYLALIPDDFTSHLLRRAAKVRLDKFYETSLARLL
jgi:hypothetical protein